VKNTLILVILRVLMPSLSLALVLALSRVFGAEGLGRYTLVFAFLYVASAIAPLGLATVITREGARSRNSLPLVFQNSLTLAGTASLLLTALLVGVAPLLGYDQETRSALMIASLALLPYTIGALQESSLIAMERMGAVAVATSTEYLIKVGGGIAMLLLGHGLDAVLWMALLGRVLACVVYAIFLRRNGVATRPSFHLVTARQLIALAPTFVSIGLFATLYWRIDVLMLSHLGTVQDIGYYGSAWRVLELLMVFPQSLCLALYPRIAASVDHDPARLSQLGSTAVRYMLAVSLPIAVGATVIAGPVLELLYGVGFEAAAATLAVLVWTCVPYGLVRYNAYVLVSSNHQHVDLAFNVVMCGVNMVLNLALIPRYGHLGAALATLSSICSYGCLQYVYMHKHLPGKSVIPLPKAAVVVGSVAGAFLGWLLHDVDLWLALSAACGAYLVCLVIGKFFTQDELELIGLRRLRGRPSLLRRS
jgi:O-antigen/teichoic acid export membrane protein